MTASRTFVFLEAVELSWAASDLDNGLVTEFQGIGEKLRRELKAAFAGHEDTALECASVFCCLEYVLRMMAQHTRWTRKPGGCT